MSNTAVITLSTFVAVILATLIIPFTSAVPSSSSLSFDTQFFESRVNPCVCHRYLKKGKKVLLNKNKHNYLFLQLFYLTSKAISGMIANKMTKNSELSTRNINSELLPIQITY